MTKLHKKQQLITFEQLPKTPTGITGLDEITGGGLPNGRPTLICGEAGCGKTLMSLEFIVRGATEFNEPGVFMAFEEKADELASNVASLGFDLIKLQDDKKLRLDHVHIDRSEIEETGEYDLEGLFIRLGFAIDSIGAKRVVLDTLENLFSGLSNQIILRAELRRLFTFLKEKGVTAIITGEKGDGSSLTRQGLEEYVSDCVILLDHRVVNQISTRRLRVVKYRGTQHGTNEYPFLIDEDGISVLPVTSLVLEKEVSSKRISSGIPSLDSMFGGKGFFQGSSILVSGTAGTGKTSIAACFANEVCNNKKKCLYFAFEESPKQILRNMKSINLDLQKHIDNGLLEFHASRPTLYGLEMHLVAIYKIIKRFKPAAVILDPITNLITVGSVSEVKSMLIRLIDFLQDEQITVMFTALSLNTVVSEQTDEGVSSLVDTWLLVRDIESNGERNRGLYIMKSRGMSHSNQVREFTITDKGLSLVDVYLGPDGVLTGSAREAQKLREKTGVALREFAISRKDKEILRRRMMLESKIASLQAEFESTEEELNKIYLEEELKQNIIERNRQEITDIRRGNADTLKSKSKSKK
ncbi:MULTISPECIES: circadian clock protein KaiC [Mucilaginibacter]|jgi:circadian clock protein KaiC|uniref:circadian clock protein KaiC n=1 Tax=Mucilaginibacter TaxID=423349 RepID=UPI0008712826|nr:MULTISPECIES: circadian clock protein KaiC [Mucilaginibacter]GGA97845.1 circadian clock protein KaiC [Mucilaginibacter rubeus]SCW50372.1 circadian clock protein KaiC [Mucilaginibacter sp. NFR10]